MSRAEPYLRVKTQDLKGDYPKWIGDQARSGSITPRAYDGRDYVIGVDAPIFVEEYSSYTTGHTVKRVGLNERFLKGQLRKTDEIDETDPAASGFGGGAGASGSGAVEENSSFDKYIESSREPLRMKEGKPKLVDTYGSESKSEETDVPDNNLTKAVIHNFEKYLVKLLPSPPAASSSSGKEESKGGDEGDGGSAITGFSSLASSRKREVKSAVLLVHEPEEILVMRAAIDYLLGSEECGVTPSEEATILVDIIERKAGIAADPKELGCHTVLLYREVMDDGRFCVTVIDPNNFGLSMHLANGDVISKLSNPNLAKIQFPFDEKSTNDIYRPEKKPPEDGFRDCIDAAAAMALAFGYKDLYNMYCNAINPSDESVPLPSFLEKNHKNISKLLLGNPVVKCMTHGVKSSEKWYDHDGPARLKQTKDVAAAIKYHKILMELDSISDRFGGISEGYKDGFIDRILPIIMGAVELEYSVLMEQIGIVVAETNLKIDDDLVEMRREVEEAVSLVGSTILDES